MGISKLRSQESSTNQRAATPRLYICRNGSVRPVCGFRASASSPCGRRRTSRGARVRRVGAYVSPSIYHYIRFLSCVSSTLCSFVPENVTPIKDVEPLESEAWPGIGIYLRAAGWAEAGFANSHACPVLTCISKRTNARPPASPLMRFTVISKLPPFFVTRSSDHLYACMISNFILR